MPPIHLTPSERRILDAVLVALSPWVASKARRPPPGIDPADSESMAWASAWKAAERCTAPEARVSYAERAFRWKVCDLRKALAVRATLTGVDWSRIAADSVRFPPTTPEKTPRAVGSKPRLSVKRLREEANRPRSAPCIECGTRGGSARGPDHYPDRIRGRCRRCAQNKRNAEKRAAKARGLEANP